MECMCGRPIPDDMYDRCPVCQNAKDRADNDTAHLRRARLEHPTNGQFVGRYSSILASPNPDLRRWGWENALDASDKHLVDIAEQEIIKIDEAKHAGSSVIGIDAGRLQGKGKPYRKSRS